MRALAPQHPEWQDKAPFRAILANDRQALARFTEQDVLALVAATHTGTTTEEFATIAREWLATAKHPRFNRLYKECVYQPMLELLAYLRANGFKTYIMSGAGSNSSGSMQRRSMAFRPSRSSAAT